MSGRLPLTLEEMNAARQALNAAPWNVSPSARTAQQNRAARTLVPTGYTYELPQSRETLCNLCHIDGTNQLSNLFVGHDHPNSEHRHLLCIEHYRANKATQIPEHTRDLCPQCRAPMGEWLPLHQKVVHTSADGTEAVRQQGTAPAPAHGGKKRRRTGRHCKRARATRRCHSSKKHKQCKKSKNQL